MLAAWELAMPCMRLNNCCCVQGLLPCQQGSGTKRLHTALRPHSFVCASSSIRNEHRRADTAARPRFPGSQADLSTELY